MLMEVLTCSFRLGVHPPFPTQWISIIDPECMQNLTTQLMNAAPGCGRQNGERIQPLKQKPQSGEPGPQTRLLDEISRLGGEERMKGARGALDSFQSALTDLVRENPQRYGAGDDFSSQRQVVAQLFESVSDSFLMRTVETLRRKEGYIRIWGYWIHRAVFTFIGFGVLAAAAFPFCAVSLMSTAPWGWLPGAAGLLVALILGGWILSRIRNQ